MRAAKLEREAQKKDGYISKSAIIKDEHGNVPKVDDDDEGEEYGSEDDEYYDSDAMVYDSEEEEAQEILQRQEVQKYMMNGKEGGILQPPEEGYDPKKESKKNQKFRAAPGVKFVEYDQHGMNKAEGLS